MDCLEGMSKIEKVNIRELARGFCVSGAALTKILDSSRDYEEARRKLIYMVFPAEKTSREEKREISGVRFTKLNTRNKRHVGNECP